MNVVASFSYEPSSVALVIAALVAFALLGAIAFSKSALIGFLGGGLGWAVIAWVALGAGSGDMTDLIQKRYGVGFGVVGAVLGAVVGFISGALGPRRPSDRGN